MNLLPPRLSRLMIATSALVIIFQLLTLPSPTQAQGEPPVPPQLSLPVQPTPERPFQLPFITPPGPTTWLLAQPYGNTLNAYYQRNRAYRASGGIHFALDFAAPCGTEIVAIADGIVFSVDGPFGSAPSQFDD